jgi:hypothetical protein
MRAQVRSKQITANLSPLFSLSKDRNLYLHHTIWVQGFRIHYRDPNNCERPNEVRSVLRNMPPRTSQSSFGAADLCILSLRLLNASVPASLSIEINKQTFSTRKLYKLKVLPFKWEQVIDALVSRMTK